MKTYFTYGGALAVGGALLTLGLFFFGFHSEASRLGAAQWIGAGGSALITFACLHFGLRARIAEVPVAEDFGYGRALGNGVLIVLTGSLLSAAVNFVYFRFINPGFADLVIHNQSQKMEEAGIAAAQIEQTEKVMRVFLQPGPQAVSALVAAMFFGTIIALLVAAYSRRPAADAPPSAG